jgi:hypothetical protein
LTSQEHPGVLPFVDFFPCWHDPNTLPLATLASHGITESAGADNADGNGTTHEVVKSSHNTAKNDTAGSTGDENVSGEGANEGGYDTDDSVEFVTGNE